MTTTSGAGPSVSALVSAHGADLHRLAAMLTADSWDATELTARTLARHDRPDSLPSPDRLRADLVRHYLRSRPRRTEGVRTTGGDAGDVLRRLSPRARAAAALRLVERWDVEQTAAAVGVSARRVEALVPRVPGLELALTGLADQHALSGPDLHEAVLSAIADGPVPAGPHRRRWGWLVAAALPAALVAGYLLDGGTEEGDTLADGPAPHVATPTVDLTEAGWRLDDDGDPPRSVMGLLLREKVMLDDGRRRVAVTLPSPSHMGYAAFGVLWCDMPPAQDAHLQVPAGTLRVGGDEIVLPCAGRDGSPPVSQVVTLPPGRTGVLEVGGDMPGGGVATLALYTEANEHIVPTPRDSVTDAPPVEDGALALDMAALQPGLFQGSRLVQPVSVGHDSTIRVWAGRAGGIAINVDGVPTTDDGDVASMMAMLSDLTPEQVEGSEPILDDPRDHADWSTQRADVRDGRWLVPAAGAVRTFEIPERVRPAPGERRTVAVEVVTENVEDLLQVVVADARAAEVDTTPVAAVPEPRAPEHVTGHRLVGEWEVPSDGQLRELQLDGSAVLPDETIVLLARDLGADLWFSWGEGAASRNGEAVPLWLQGDLDTVLRELRQPWFEPLPAGPDPLLVAAPPALGHPPTTVLAYTPVPYEDFDFEAAAVPPDAWPAGTDLPADPFLNTHFYRVVDVLGPEDVEDGRITYQIADGSARVAPGQGLAVRVTTEGRGRMRFLVNDRAGDSMWATEGWWSSWTTEHVTSDVELLYPGQLGPPYELTVDVEDYEDFTIEVLTG